MICEVMIISDVKIQNVVGSSSFNTVLDLNALNDILEDANYKPETFPGLIYRLKDPKCTILIFRNGKIVCSGAKHIKDIQSSIIKLGKTLAKVYPDIERSPDFTIQNIVGTYDINAVLNLPTIAISVGLEQVEYEPEQFPGLVYRMREPKVVLLLFATGKVVITGGKSVEEMEQAGKNIHKLMVEMNFI